MDALVLQDGAIGVGGAATALLPGQRMLLHINAPLPQPLPHSHMKREFDSMSVRIRTAARREAGGAVSRAAGMRRNWHEARTSLFEVLMAA